MKKRLLLLFLAGLSFQLSNAQEIDKAKLDQYFDLLEANNKFMGNIALSKNGQLVYSRALGFADVESNKKADTGSKYRIGSISKTFTAVLVMKAVEQGKLSLDQTIEGYFPKVKNADKITIKSLLNHRSGVHSFTSEPDYLTWNTQPKTQQELVDMISGYASDFEPESKTAYSNSNYVLLTIIVEKALKDSYAKLLQKHIAKPLGLKDTYVGGKINLSANEVRSYTAAPRGKWDIQPETDMSVPLGAGNLVSTAMDLAKFSDGIHR